MSISIMGYNGLFLIWISFKCVDDYSVCCVLTHFCVCLDL
jgi:hypothetical protein